MAINLSRIAYQDCYDLMEKAISSEYPTGLRIKFANRNEAIHFRQRLHNARYVDRLDNTKVYPDGHQMYGRSIYDIINVRVRQLTDGWWLRLERVDARQFEIVALEEDEIAALPPPPPPTSATITNGGGMNLVVPVVPIRGKFLRRF